MSPRNRKKQASPYPLRKTPFILLFFFILLGLAGVAADEPLRVLEQARQICLSCIGIG